MLWNTTESREIQLKNKNAVVLQILSAMESEKKKREDKLVTWTLEMEKILMGKKSMFLYFEIYVLF